MPFSKPTAHGKTVHGSGQWRFFKVSNRETDRQSRLAGIVPWTAGLRLAFRSFPRRERLVARPRFEKRRPTDPDPLAKRVQQGGHFIGACPTCTALYTLGPVHWSQQECDPFFSPVVIY